MPTAQIIPMPASESELPCITARRLRGMAQTPEAFSSISWAAAANRAARTIGELGGQIESLERLNLQESIRHRRRETSLPAFVCGLVLGSLFVLGILLGIDLAVYLSR